MVDFSQSPWPREICTHPTHHVFSAGIAEPKEAAKTQRQEALAKVPPTVTIKHQGVDHRKVAHLVEQTRRIVLEVKIGVPHHYTVERHSVSSGVHESECHVVTTHKDGQWVVAGDIDWKRRIPPRRIGKSAFAGIPQRQSSVA